MEGCKLLMATWPVRRNPAMRPLWTPRATRSLNLARASQGAQLEITGAAKPANATLAAASLLRDDDPIGYALPAGQTSMILALPKTDVLQPLQFSQPHRERQGDRVCFRREAACG